MSAYSLNTVNCDKQLPEERKKAVFVNNLLSLETTVELPTSSFLIAVFWGSDESKIIINRQKVAFWNYKFVNEDHVSDLEREKKSTNSSLILL